MIQAKSKYEEASFTHGRGFRGLLLALPVSILLWILILALIF